MRLAIPVSGFVAAALFSTAAGGEAVRVHGRVNAAVPATGPQKDEQSWGALTAVMLEVPIVPQLGVGVEVGAVTLSDGEPPSDSRLADPDGAFGLSGALAVHVRPAATREPGNPKWHSGLWGGGSFGVMRSAGLLRPMGEVNVGLDFKLGDSSLSAGPSVGFLHVFQPDDSLRPADANVLSVGLHALLDTATQVVPAPSPMPPMDRDGDGLFDGADTCPDAPEDADGFQDADGCPDLDNDGDSLLDPADRCPLEAEDGDGFEDADGCPDPDNDVDGVLDAADACPLEGEDVDALIDEDGCPELDADQDGVLDEADACPSEAEVQNGYADEDGCPDTQNVRVVRDKILLDERINFHTNSVIIRSISHPLLRRLGQLMNEHPEYTHIEVQGHADSRGDPGFNQRLSDGRARAVMKFLVEQVGVDRRRLDATGYGNLHPLITGNDPRSLYMNRRVEFSITREGSPAPAVPPDAPGSSSSPDVKDDE